jgi:hypothetical protein
MLGAFSAGRQFLSSGGCTGAETPLGAQAVLPEATGASRIAGRADFLHMRGAWLVHALCMPPIEV